MIARRVVGAVLLAGSLSLFLAASMSTAAGGHLTDELFANPLVTGLGVLTVLLTPVAGAMLFVGREP